MYEFYNISFYHLNARQQRLVLFMISKSQKPELILLLGVMPLAVSTALKVRDVRTFQFIFRINIYLYTLRFS